MSTVLFLAHTECDGTLHKSALETLTAAKGLAEKLGHTLAVGIIGADVAAAADCVAGCGAKIFGVSGPGFADARYASDLAAAEAMARACGAQIIVAPATSRFSRALPGLAVRLEGRVDTHLCGLDVVGGQPVARRWFYRQRMEGTLTRSERPWVLTLDSGCAEPFSGAGKAEVEALSVDVSSVRTTVAGLECPSADQQTIRPDARVLLVAGAGWTKKQADGAIHVDVAEETILTFLNATKSSLGSSKSLVDISGEGNAVISYLTHMHQVGQTGASPRHAKGLSTCCHGEEPHVVGWRFIAERRAINTDAGCGWAQGKCDVLYVGDAFAIMKKVNELLG
ncbi:MAG: electron transfer flavoprotein subunit alpha [Pseudodesulfovibrio sp.]|uniref:Electron transfer flavoprotein alpha/beta-subunit n=1 Tax=Pseudodesulfovibrio aespoeensis (strain ATCC 700646 / DSM 10631 / Aspo-2) TaxID=643562 RepID=E6VWA2_PSEA9|nr:MULTISPECIES: electron transfer flavoprotein subunit alpha [Pseudodesulfovibrio]MBU4192984.1 electron transfer flavoprotein subunit alpha [Pseudomonadota bacterium]ADU63662.1 Electron transfer flavoprotein alpha/beta-subunit [Pseudodesulfovibrio aespoeensis Aspo-2]MBU4244945.1 electron transfer flavoprotein subunit alpha [Pseudomonadota bacterium]MBU4378065.1 electron transfer flavoprotein subunit alpha [Pseudomonadota bacterium]MBU4475548.1 electron transfer flavoprotein subunit alpha [Pse